MVQWADEPHLHLAVLLAVGLSVLFAAGLPVLLAAGLVAFLAAGLTVFLAVDCLQYGYLWCGHHPENEVRLRIWCRVSVWCHSQVAMLVQERCVGLELY